MPTMTLIDRGDGTGADVTVSGMTAAVQLYVTKVVDGVPRSAWVSQETGPTFNVSRPLALPPGFYWAMLVPATGLPTLPYPLVVTSGLPAAAQQVEESIVAKLKMLNLPEIGQNVFGQHNYATAIEVSFPCVHVTSVDLSESEQDGTNLIDELWLPYRVLCMDYFSPANQDQRKKYRTWRQTISRAFRNQPLLGLAYVKQVLVENLTITPEGVATIDGVNLDLFVSGFTFNVAVSDPRGWGA